MKRDLPLFVYGTLMYPEVFEQVTGWCPDYFPAFLPDYAPKCLLHRPYPGLISLAGHQTQGLVIYDLSEADWARLDAYEGTEYCLGEVVVFLQQGPLAALTYLLAPAAQQLATEVIWLPELERLKR